MSTNQAVRSNLALTSNPQQVGPSLAHVICYEAGREIILGQAWLAAPNKMVTCGHVVDQFVQSPQAVSVKFPSSGNTYQVLQIKLHPSFVRQPDGLVKFDVAMLIVDLEPPETQASALPFSFEHNLKQNQSLSAIRYPVHLGQLSAALEPLSQEGKFLGLLRKHDNFHLLHDLPLAPGDSGAPVCENNRVVAIHCGDTATIPGLNLPTTSIRLALWVDALRELGLSQTRGGIGAVSKPLGVAAVVFLLTAAISYFVFKPMFPDRAASQKSAWSVDPPEIGPVEIRYGKNLANYQAGDTFEIRAIPTSDCYLYAFLSKANLEKKGVFVLNPRFNQQRKNTKAKAKDTVRIDKTGEEALAPGQVEATIYVLAISPTIPEAENCSMLFPNDKWQSTVTQNEAGKGKIVDILLVPKDELVKSLKALEAKYPGKVIFWAGPGPVAGKGQD